MQLIKLNHNHLFQVKKNLSDKQKSRVVKMIKFAALLLLLSGCATTKVCPSEEQEKVSMCRAEVACEPNAGQRFAAGYSGQVHIMTANKNMCMANHIEAQKANAGLKLMEQALPEQTKK